METLNILCYVHTIANLTLSGNLQSTTWITDVSEKKEIRKKGSRYMVYTKL